MYLRDIAVTYEQSLRDRFSIEKLNRFKDESCTVSELYRFLMRRRILTKDNAKVIVSFDDSVTSPPSEFFPMHCVWPFDFGRYFDAEFAARKRLILESMRAALLWMAKLNGWEEQAFHEIHDEALRRNIVLDGYLKKKWLTTDRRYRVKVYFRFEPDGVIMDAVLTLARKDDEIARRRLGSPPPFPGCMSYYADQGHWTSPSVFCLGSSTFTREKWFADFTDVIPAKKT